MLLERQLPGINPIGALVETLPNQERECWVPESSSDMAASSQNPYPRSPNPSTRSYDSSSVSSTTSPRPPQGQYLPSLMNTGSRPNAAPPPQPIGIPPPLPPPVGQNTFQPYTPMTGNFGMGRDSLPSSESVVDTPGSSTTPLPPLRSNPHKRAYRQRRKDPSCDACRERKVKCDATETMSCSECSSRNVKCQFTKETNRRMSSIKQVQDLEKHLHRVQRENTSLRRMLQERDGHMDVDVDGVEQVPLQLPEIGSEPKRRKRPAAVYDFGRARSNLREFSRGVWKAPAQFRHATSRPRFDPPRPEIPPRQVTERLLSSYYASVHAMFPILHWPTFQDAVDEMHKVSPQLVQPAWLSMFFAVLALGGLFGSDSNDSRFYQPAELLEASRKLVDPWNNDYTLDNVRTLVLITICLNEMNQKSAAWLWLGTAVRAGQDLGLHSESGAWSVIEGEMRRRVWWAIYIMDRTMAAELGRPVLISDGDCDVSLPAGVDDHFIQGGGIHVPAGREPLTHSLLAVIHVVRSYGALIKTLSSPVIAPTRLATFDQHLAACLRTFPPSCDASSAVPLSPYFLAPLAYLLNARLILHRHNLSPSCAAEARMSAVEQCTHTALETHSLLSRTNAPITDSATALLTTHIFRCTLFLLLTGYWDQAIACTRALASINSRRDVAVPCGRFLAFFVATLTSKRTEHAAFLARTTPPQPFAPPPRPAPSALQGALLRDEELLVYVSADLQACPDAAWVWAGGESDPPPASPSGVGSGLFSPEQRTGLTEEDNREWGGWERLEGAIRTLASGNTTPTPTSATWGQSLPPAMKSEQGSATLPLPPPTPATGGTVGTTGTVGTVGTEGTESSGGGGNNSPTGRTRSQERISIANII